jgi:hypothetical protein
MERAIHRSPETRAEPTGRRLKAWATGGVAAGIAVVAFAAVAVAPAGATSARSGAGVLPHVRTSACTIQERAAFKPARVVEGHYAHLVVVLRNCTASSQTVNLTRYGKLVCIVADPVAQAITLSAGQTEAFRFKYLAPSCAGSGQITARVSSSGGKQLATRTAHVKVLAPPPST